MFCAVRNDLDQSLWTGSNTLAAGYALFLVYNSYAVYNMDRVKLTCLYTGTKTGTAVAAGLRTAGRHYRCLCTVINTFVVVKSLNLVTGTFTTYKCNLLLCCSGRYAKDSSDLFAYRCSTYRTCICRSFALCNCLCQRVTACETAAAAVVSRKFLTDSYFLFIYFYLELLTEIPATAITAAAIKIAVMFIFVSSFYSNPENPKNAIAIRPAVTSTIGDPWKLYGISFPSIRSRIPARSTMETV